MVSDKVKQVYNKKSEIKVEYFRKKERFYPGEINRGVDLPSDVVLKTDDIYLSEDIQNEIKQFYLDKINEILSKDDDYDPVLVKVDSKGDIEDLHFRKGFSSNFIKTFIIDLVAFLFFDIISSFAGGGFLSIICFIAKFAIPAILSLVLYYSSKAEEELIKKSSILTEEDKQKAYKTKYGHLLAFVVLFIIAIALPLILFGSIM